MIVAQAELRQARMLLEEARAGVSAGSGPARHLDALLARTDVDIDRLGIRSICCPKATPETIDQALASRYDLRPDDALGVGAPIQWEFLEFFEGPAEPEDRITFAVCHDDDGLIVDVEGRAAADLDFDAHWAMTPEHFMQLWLVQFSFDTAHDHTHSLGLQLLPDGSQAPCVLTTLAPGRSNAHVVDETRRGWQIHLEVTGSRSWRARAHLPFSALGETPRPGRIWGFDLACRPRPKEGIEYHFNATFESWCEGNAPRFGHLVFG